MTDFPSLPRVPATRPFRVGVSSFVHPADILPNVRAVAPFVDDVELLFFESGEHAVLPGARDIRELCDLAAGHNLTYTVHLPIDRALGSPSPSEREHLTTQVLRIIDACRPLDPFGWLLHVEGLDAGATAERRREWQADVFPLLDRISRHAGAPDRLCLENVAYPFAWCDPFLERLGCSVCLDAGHLWQGGYDWRAHVVRYLARTRVIHLYGTGAGSRHLALSTAPPDLVRDFLAAIGSYTGVLTLETFGYDDTRASLERLSECLT